jgi:hypothetical protein
MNEILINADGTTTVVGDAGSVSGILSELIQANTIPPEYDDDGVETKAAIVPDADTLAVEITAADLKTHAWRVPKARVERLGEIRGTRNAKLVKLDVEYQLADEGVHPSGHTKAQVATSKKVLRDVPIEAKSHLAILNNTDDISAYIPNALK